jgi:hypothetical protein
VTLPEDTLPTVQDGEEEMALVKCIRCGHQKEILVRYRTGSAFTDDVLRGTLICKEEPRRGHPCNGTTIFELADNAITFYPGRLFQTDLYRDIAQDAVEMLLEAVKCFYGDSNRGVVAFCRSAAEEALGEKKVPGRDLNTKIEKAGEYLTAEEQALANAARITGRNALHHLAVVSTANALGALTNTADLLNSVSEKEPFPTWQSKQGSSEA